MNTFEQQAIDIIHKNNKEYYNVPNNDVYPFQWNWDTGFTAYGWMHINEDRAWIEIESLLKAQWKNGMIPNIVFHQHSPNYFPNIDVWQTKHVPQTSGVTQPPIIASFVHMMYKESSDLSLYEDRISKMYTQLLHNHRWWHKVRDPEQIGLVYMYHPWESGMDNSPEWDAACVDIPMTNTQFVRKDTAYVDASERPLDEDYKKFIHIVEVARSVEYDYTKYFAMSQFTIAHIGINAILGWADSHLLALAKIFGTADEIEEINKWINKTTFSLETLWNANLNLYSSWNAKTQSLIDVPVVAGLLPLLSDMCPPKRLDVMKKQVHTWIAESRPSTFRSYSGYEPQRYWRGPTWNIMDWLIYQACVYQGWNQEAEQILNDSLNMVEKNGFWEYYDNLTQKGCGGSNFSWTAATYLVMNAKKNLFKGGNL